MADTIEVKTSSNHGESRGRELNTNLFILKEVLITLEIRRDLN